MHVCMYVYVVAMLEVDAGGCEVVRLRGCEVVYVYMWEAMLDGRDAGGSEVLRL